MLSNKYLSEEALKRIQKALNLKAKVKTFSLVEEKIHEIFAIETYGEDTHIGLYDVHIKVEPSCTCPDFRIRESKGKAYLACKHLYWVFLKVLGCSQNEHMFIHQPIMSRIDVHNALSRRRTYPSLV